MKNKFVLLILLGLLGIIGVGTVQAANSNPGVIPNKGFMYGELGAEWRL
jgi:hypothetical protein